MGRAVVRYSEAFKLQVVEMLESGEASCAYEISQKFGIIGTDTVGRWVRQYGKNHLLPKVVRVEKPGEQEELIRLRRQIKQLKEALADSHVEASLNRSFFEVLCRHTGQDPEEFKKKAWRESVEASSGRDASLALSRLCAKVGRSRQGFYKQRQARQRQDSHAELVLELVQEQRRIHPRLGGRKLWHLLQEDLKDLGIALGRDRLFELLRDQGLLIERKARVVRTTNSRHGFAVYRNLIRSIAPSMPEQIWVSDLTYLRTMEGFLYLSLITDAYSRKIVGYEVSDTLEAEGCVRSLKMALKSLRHGAAPIHHSDRGTQYCSGPYVGLLKKHGLDISMTEQNHCYENAQAERVNGILKMEYALGGNFRTKDQAKTAAHQAVRLYNDLRPHLGLNYRTPTMVHASAEEDGQSKNEFFALRSKQGGRKSHWPEGQQLLASTPDVALELLSSSALSSTWEQQDGK